VVTFVKYQQSKHINTHFVIYILSKVVAKRLGCQKQQTGILQFFQEVLVEVFSGV
jgi:hypothetical protein